MRVNRPNQKKSGPDGAARDTRPGDRATDEAQQGFDDAAGGDRSRVDSVYDDILLRIIRGDLAEGTELKTTQIAHDLGVSRTPVIQALARLASDGIVVQRANHRAVIRQGAGNWLVELHELRTLLEPTAAGLAATRIENDELDRLEAMARDAQPDASTRWCQAARRFDYALHLAIADACSQLALAETIRRCWGFKRLSYEAMEEPPETLAKGYREHLAILEALRSHDGPTAEAAMLFHLRSAENLRPASRIV